MTKEDKEFLAELAQELRTQDNCGTRNPVWCIMDKEWVVKPEGCGDELIICFNETDYTKEEFANELIDNYSLRGEKKEDNAFEDICECTNAQDLRDTVLEYFSDVDIYDIDMVERTLEDCISEDATAFLTKKSAEEHLRLNAHHYHKEARAYALSAWRNPVYERVIEIIKNTNWEEL